MTDRCSSSTSTSVSPNFLLTRGCASAPLIGASGYEELIRLLDERIARSDDEDEKGRLRRLRDAASDVGRGVLSAVIYDLIRRVAGVA